VGILVGFVGLY